MRTGRERVRDDVSCRNGLIVDTGHTVPVRRSMRLQRTHYEPSGLSVVIVWATASKAAKRCEGNARPRFSARRRIPAAALGLKKYLEGTPS
jgi:hypothetical protein